MNILLTGATGFVGSRLIAKLLKETNHSFLLTTRNPQKDSLVRDGRIEYIRWDGLNEPFPKVDKKIDGIINLMGENISKARWSKKQKEKLWDSRIKATKELALFVQSLETKPSFILGASAIGIYPSNDSAEHNESSPLGEGFLADLCKAWEEATKEVPASRVIISRIGVVLGKNGGALSKLLPIFKLGAGGPIGTGQQMMSWIHIDDLVDAIYFLCFQSDLSGTFNMTAPNPINNLEFSKSLANSLKRPCLFPVPPLALKLAYGEMSCIMLDSQIVKSSRLQEEGFRFSFPRISMAFEQIARES